MSAAIAMIPEVVGLQDAVGLLSEAIGRDRIDRQQRRYRNRLRRVLWKMWQAQRRSMTEHWFPYLQASHLFLEAASAGSTDGIIRILDGLFQQEEVEWARKIESILIAIAVLAALSSIQPLKISISFDLPTDRIEAQLRAHSAKLVTGLNETTREQLRRILETSVAERRSYSETARLLRKQFNDFGTLAPQHHIRDRAELITVTEIGNAYTRGIVETGNGLVAAGIPMEKAWLTAGDERVEPDCEENEAAGWIPWEEDFPSGHTHPLAHPACRCALQIQRRGDE